ncbi:MAG: acyltransferase [Prevotellaceae bacterium]|jgi:peptidoglycan/LPS O-acetylase OafA/YrhL|nr:acyltransferase [Prevotellaceae bacterium]
MRYKLVERGNPANPTAPETEVMIKRERIKHIDGLRAIAVLAVILFHFGYLPNGFLGVDVFFVISGFLITGLIYSECKEKRFSVKRFYLRRIRRILPMVSLITVLAMIVGLFVMLPDDLENLAESAVATTLFGNNILQAITTKDYWNAVNEFKPLMHTWSLGIEEQYYFLYPFLFLVFSSERIRFILPALIALTILSLALYFTPFFDSPAKFYYLPFRFFELSSGGISAILLKEKMLTKKSPLLSAFFLFLILSLLIIGMEAIPNQLLLCVIVVATCGVIMFTVDGKNISCAILQNKPILYIGLISFSLYMWHQFAVAFARYFLWEEVTAQAYVIIFVVTFIASICSYHFIEQPFRNKKTISAKSLFAVLIPVNSLILILGMFLFFRAGIIRDVPELGITTQNVTRGLHAVYNSRIDAYDRDFTETDKVHILLIGNSFARDFGNILLESKWNEKIEIAWISDTEDPRITDRMKNAELLFYAFDKEEYYRRIPQNDTEKAFCVGVKRFGNNAGFFYNYNGQDYYSQRTKLGKKELELNDKLREQWGNKFIDIVGYIIDDNNTVPIFTPDRRFISQDCLHLTEGGAEYFAKLLEEDREFVLNKLILP